jgi:signal transduction histidine kinase
MIKTINTSSCSIFSLLENLLEWARIQRGQTKYKPLPQKAYNIVQEAINTHKNIFVTKNISIKQSISDDIVVNIDKTSILSVLNNLLTNAAKFTPEGGSISFSAINLENVMVEFAVCDTGIGMDEIMQENLFKIDADVKRSGTNNEPSSGLGLLICKEFVEMNGGKMRVKSQKNKGSCFYFTVPAY